MTEKTITKVIPEHTVESVVYVAQDGREFVWRSECERYEERLKVLSHPAFASHVDGICLPDLGCYASLYHFTSDNDYEFFVQCRGQCDTDYGEHGPGWYLYYETSVGDYDDQRLLHLDTYIKEREDEVNEFVRQVKNAIEKGKTNGEHA